MINKTFFHFILGFIAIIFGSLTFLFTLGFYETEFAKKDTLNNSGAVILNGEEKIDVLNSYVEIDLPSENIPAPKKIEILDTKPQLE